MSELSYMKKLLGGVDVEWLPISKVFDLRNGYTPSKSKKEYWKNGDIPWFRMDDIRENGRILGDSLQRISSCAVKGGKLFPKKSILISTSATIGEHALVTVPHLANQRFTCLTLKVSYIDCFDIKFLFYYCFSLADWCRKNTTMSNFSSVDMDGFRKFLIPLPCPENREKSFAIQSEIVRILDTFSALTAELTAELTARKKQYNYYRDQLLSFKESEVEWKTLGEVAKFRRGTAITQKQTMPGDIPVVANGPTPSYFHCESNRQGETIVIARSGAYAGYVSFWNQPIFLTDAFSVHPDLKIVKPKFIYHVLQNKQEHIHAMKKGAGVPHVRVKEFESYDVPIPHLAEQARIVSILDKFDVLTTSISEGLPREIKLRQKQYEYYRDLLFCFLKPDAVAN